MKIINKIFICILISLNASLGFSQDYTSFEINNVSYENAREAVNKTLNDLKLGGHLWKNQPTTESNFYYYNVIQ